MEKACGYAYARREEGRTVSDGEDSDAHTLGLLNELRVLAQEISYGHSDYSERFHELLNRVSNPNLPDVAKDFGFRVMSSNVIE
jgi:hypothetical protein